MVEILSGKEEAKYGEIEYFIKSDYGSQETLKIARMELNKGGLDKPIKDWYEKVVEKENENKYMSNLFKDLEAPPFCKICVGGFDKTSSANRTIGQEFIWCRGFPEGYSEE